MALTYRRTLPELKLWCRTDGCTNTWLRTPISEVQNADATHATFTFMLNGPDTCTRDDSLLCGSCAAAYDKKHTKDKHPAPPPKSLEERLLAALDALDEVRKLGKAERELAGEDVKASVDALVGLLDAAEPYAEVLKKILGKTTEAA